MVAWSIHASDYYESIDTSDRADEDDPGLASDEDVEDASQEHGEGSEDPKPAWGHSHVLEHSGIRDAYTAPPPTQTPERSSTGGIRARGISFAEYDLLLQYGVWKKNREPSDAVPLHIVAGAETLRSVGQSV
jgi:hypothetical protein